MIDHILKKNSIVDYLKHRGHHPVRHTSGGKLFYNCPLPGHQESKPSFVVWTEASFENFYCFGCQRSYSIIHLISLIEGISYRAVLKRLADGVDVSPIADMEYSLDRMSEDFIRPSPFDTPELLLEISSMCRLYLESVEFNPDEQCIIQMMWKQIDADLLEFRFADIEETFRNLPMALANRQEKWKSMRYEREKQAYASSGDSTSV